MSVAIVARWTKMFDEWGVQVPHDVTLESSQSVDVASRAGDIKTVIVGDFLGASQWGNVYGIAPVETVTEGYFLRGGEVYKVRTSKAGNRYATMLTIEGGRGRWEYVTGAIRNLTEGDRITLEKAAEFGHLHGLCAICGRTLTDPASVERGIGPVCATRV
jgi:hypothetical protein